MSVYKGSTLIATTNVASLEFTEEGKLKLKNSQGGTFEVTPEDAVTEDSKRMVTSGAVWKSVQRNTVVVDTKEPLEVSLEPAGTWRYEKAATYDSTASYYIQQAGGYVSVEVADEYQFSTDFYIDSDGTGTYTHVTNEDTFSASETYCIEDGTGGYVTAPNQPTLQTWFTDKYTRTQAATNTYTVSASMDSVPTAGSGKLVSSGAVEKAIREAVPEIEAEEPVKVESETDVDNITTVTVSVETDDAPTAESGKLLTSGAIKDAIDKVDLDVTAEAPLNVQRREAGDWVYTKATVFAAGTDYFVEAGAGAYTDAGITEEYQFNTEYFLPDDSGNYVAVTSSDAYDASETYYVYDEDSTSYVVAEHQPTALTWFTDKYTRAEAASPSVHISLDVDSALSASSENPVQNKTVAEKFAEVAGTLDRAALSVVTLPTATSAMENMVRFNLTDNKWYLCVEDEEEAGAYIWHDLTGDLLDTTDEVTEDDMRPVTSNAVAQVTGTLQPKELETALTINGTTQEDVEGALGELTKASKLLTTTETDCNNILGIQGQECTYINNNTLTANVPEKSFSILVVDRTSAVRCTQIWYATNASGVTMYTRQSTAIGASGTWSTWQKVAKASDIKNWALADVLNVAEETDLSDLRGSEDFMRQVYVPSSISSNGLTLPAYFRGTLACNSSALYLWGSVGAASYMYYLGSSGWQGGQVVTSPMVAGGAKYQVATLGMGYELYNSTKLVGYVKLRTFYARPCHLVLLCGTTSWADVIVATHSAPTSTCQIYWHGPSTAAVRAYSESVSGGESITTLLFRMTTNTTSCILALSPESCSDYHVQFRGSGQATTTEWDEHESDAATTRNASAAVITGQSTGTYSYNFSTNVNMVTVIWHRGTTVWGMATMDRFSNTVSEMIRGGTNAGAITFEWHSVDDLETAARLDITSTLTVVTEITLICGAGVYTGSRKKEE